MAKIQFKVSAKTARLIGRENITGVDGAIIELVKNAYDADASCVYVQYGIKYPYLMNELDMNLIDHDLSKSELDTFSLLYDRGIGIYMKRSVESFITEEKNLAQATAEYNELSQEVQKILFAKNYIVIADNGVGMTRKVIENSWMRIGTSDKELNYVSGKGRIKTGAKGIGRFALDKLSTATVMYTKSNEDDFISWKINWDQFSNVKLLNEIDAEIDVCEQSLESVVREHVGDWNPDILNKHSWDTGTVIILHPMREPWNERLYKKINTSLNNLNPLADEDIFDIYVENIYNEEYSMISTHYTMTQDDYDYKVNANYDGDNLVSITIARNEMITRIFEFQHEYDLNDVKTLSTEEFWARQAFHDYPYKREVYNVPFTINYPIESLLEGIALDSIKNVGPFSFDFYFLKSMKSSFPIIKNVKRGSRSDLLEKHGGIKLYRDNFKVRPYGEEGMLYDWLGLAAAAAKQPAAVTHPTGKWNVPPYQVIGNVHIGRMANPKLYDMANREGLVDNEEYNAFKKLLLKIIEKFEYDRQYFYREYSKWIDENQTHVIESVIKKVVSGKSKADNQENTNQNDHESFSEDTYREAIIHEHQNKKKLEDTLQLLMAFSSAGIMTNTFSHELSRVGENVGDRLLHIKSCIDDILGYKPYEGDEVFNPYLVIDDAIDNDEVMQSWIDIVMKAVANENYEPNICDISRQIDVINEIWEPLMGKKKIAISRLGEETYNKFFVSIAIIDLFTLINNLNINSAWFLEQIELAQRKIDFNVYEESGHIVVEMINNGPKLSPEYENTPNIIFEPRVTSKGSKGTGLGLWIVKRIVDKYNAQISVLHPEDGFGLKIFFDKENLNG